MPANLTPLYLKAEREYRRAQSVEEQVRCLETMLQLIPKHKGTDRLQGDLKRRLKETREEQLREKSAPKGGGPAFRFARQGAGTVVIIGGPNAGKSRIVAELTNAEPEVASYPFTTREPMPAIMDWQDTRVQLIDTPPITSAPLDPWHLNMIRRADAVLLVMSGENDDAPDDTITVITELARRRTRLANRTGFHENDFSIINVKTLLVVTHGSDSAHDLRLELFRELAPVPLPEFVVELTDAGSCSQLRTAIFRLLDVIRCYTKKPGMAADKADPFTLPCGSTVDDLAMKVHRELAEQLRDARVWSGDGADGRIVGRSHVLQDQDVVELHW